MKKKTPSAKVLILLCAVILCIFCLILAPSESHGRKDAFINEGAAREETDVKREIGNVIEDNTEYFVIENLKGERYILDKSAYPDFNTGDRVVLSYSKREENIDGTYSVSPVLLDYMKTHPEKAGD